MFFTIFNPFLRNFHPLFARFFTSIYPLFFTIFHQKNSLFYNSFYLVLSNGITLSHTHHSTFSPKTYLPPILVFSSFVPKHFSFTIPLFHPISTTFHTLFAQDSAFLYTHFSLFCRHFERSLVIQRVWKTRRISWKGYSLKRSNTSLAKHSPPHRYSKHKRSSATSLSSLTCPIFCKAPLSVILFSTS